MCDNVQALVEIETHVSESNLENDGNLTLKAKTSPEDDCESIECHEDLLIEGNEANNITLSIVKDETLHNNSNCEMVEQNDQDFSLVEDTPADSFDLK